MKLQLCDAKSLIFVGFFLQSGWYFSVAAWIFNPLLYQLSYLGTLCWAGDTQGPEGCPEGKRPSVSLRRSVVRG